MPADRPAGPWLRAWRRARGRPASAAGALIVLLFVATALAAPWIATVDPIQGDWKQIRKAPTWPHPSETNDLARATYPGGTGGARIPCGAGAGRRRRAPHDPARPAQHRELAPRPGHDLDPDRDHRRGDSVVPRARRAAAGAELGHDAQHRAAVPRDRAVDGLVAGDRDLLADALVQPRRRRLARPARSPGLLSRGYNSPHAPDHRSAGAPRPDPDDRRGAPGTGARPPPGRQGPAAGGCGGRPHRQAAQGRGRLRVEPRARARDGAADRARPPPGGPRRPRPGRLRRRRMDRPEARAARPQARVADRAAPPERVSLPGRRVLHRDADAHDLGDRPDRRPSSGRGGRRGVPRRPDQGGGRARARNPPRSLPARDDRAVLHHRDRVPSRRADRAHRELDRRRSRPALLTMSASFEFLSPDHFTAGAVGQPGQRVFYVQSREKGQLVTLKREKEQVRALAEYLGSLLNRLPGGGVAPTGNLALIEPIDAAWAVSSIAVGYDEARDRILVVANEAVEEDAEGEPASARFLISRAQAAAFVKQADTLMKASRPICPWCNQPRDPTGHTCPRSNGHVHH